MIIKLKLNDEKLVNDLIFSRVLNCRHSVEWYLKKQQQGILVSYRRGGRKKFRRVKGEIEILPFTGAGGWIDSSTKSAKYRAMRS